MEIEKHFLKANLPVKVEDAPLRGGEGTQDTIQMDVGKKGKQEFFRVYLGHEDNRFQVLNVDPKQQQAVVMVHEPSREFEVTERHPFGPRLLDNFRGSRKDLVAFDNKTVTIRRKTPDHKRHYLMGMDECHLFIAELPKGVSTVTDAHRALKGNQAKTEETKRKNSVRQGEWFFFPVSEVEDNEINQNIKKQMAVYHRKHRIGDESARKPHVAEELVFSGSNTYVRGKVRHPDHATIEFHHWHKVIGNAEVRTAPARFGAQRSFFTD